MRPTHDETGLQYAAVAQRRATCLRRAVGCCLVNARNQVLATGYNGRAAGLPHCNVTNVSCAEAAKYGESIGDVARREPYPFACAGALRADGKLANKSGANLDGCEAIHAEQNALLQCDDVYAIDTCYVTHSPCLTCVKLLLNTSCRRVVFRERYAHDDASRLLWDRANREWLHLP